MNNNHLESLLIPALEKSADIATFQLFVTSNHSIKSGFVNDRFGGIYRPVTNSIVEKITFQVELKDGRSSIGSAPYDITPDSLLAQIKASAHHAAQPIVFAPVYKPNEITKVKLFDKAIHDVIKQSPNKVSDITKQLQTTQLAHKHELVKGGVRFMTNYQRLVSSRGVDMTETSTRESIYSYFEDRIGAGVAKRELFNPSEITQQSNYYSKYVRALLGKSANLKAGKYPILLDADTGWSLLDTFVLSNLRGLGVDAGLSRFKLDDFTSERAIAHPGFSLSYDQLKPMSTESFGFSSKGTLPQKFKLIQNGKLIEPICEPKTATKLGYVARSLGESLTHEVTSNSYDDFVSQHDSFLLVFGAMGINAVNSVLGQYSLPAPDVLLIQKGEVMGRVNCVLSGDFFEVLMEPSTGFVDAPHLFDSPALTFETQVSVK